MSDSIQYKGLWWLPNQPDVKVPGVLTFVPFEVPSLELIGHFVVDSNEHGVDIILGSCPAGPMITLYKCLGTHFISISTEEQHVTSFVANLVFVGANFEVIEEIRFRRIYVHYEYLDFWMNNSGFHKYVFDNPGSIEIAYQEPDTISIPINNNFNISIEIKTTYPSRSIGQTEMSIKQKAFFCIEGEEEMHIEVFLGIIFQIGNLLSLSMMLPVNPTMIEGETQKYPHFIKGDNGQLEPLDLGERYRPIEIYCLLKRDKRQKEKIYPFQMVFSFEDIRDDIQVYFRNWFNNLEAIKPVYDLFFGDLHMPEMYHEMRFLVLMQGIETYHRRRRKNTVLDTEEYTAKIQTILDSVSDECREWLERRLEYSNEPPLAQRVKEIINELPLELRKLIGREKKFTYKVVATRNYLTHYNDKLREQAFKHHDLAQVIRKLRMILVFILLHEMGIRKEFIDVFMTKNSQVKQNFYLE